MMHFIRKNSVVYGMRYVVWIHRVLLLKTSLQLVNMDAVWMDGTKKDDKDRFLCECKKEVQLERCTFHRYTSLLAVVLYLRKVSY
jgi:hypothetical protein